MARIVILGCGFSGLYAAFEILKNLRESDQLIIISNDDKFVLTPLLHEISTNSISPSDISVPIHSLLKSYKNYKFVKDKVNSINFNAKVIETGRQNISYDYLLISLGSVPNRTVLPNGIKQKNIYVIKTLDDAIKILSGLQNILSLYLEKTQKNYVNILIVGAGATGIEMAGEICSFFKLHSKKYNKKKTNIVNIYLLQIFDGIFPDKAKSFREKIKKRLQASGINVLYNTKLISYKNSRAVIKTKDKKRELYAQMVLLTAGVIPTPLITTPKKNMSNGAFEVNDFLEVKNTEKVWAAGDIAYFINPSDRRPVPMLAQTAKDQGKFIGKNIIAKIKGKPQKAYEFHSKGFIISIGKGYGIGDIYGVLMSGWFIWWLKRTVYAIEFPSVRNKIKMLWKLSIRSLFRNYKS